MSNDLQNKAIFQQVVELLQNARQEVLRTVNSTMTTTYFEIGRIIVEEEQNGKDRAEYGKQLLKGLSQQLTKEFGKGHIRLISDKNDLEVLFWRAEEEGITEKLKPLSGKRISIIGVPKVSEWNGRKKVSVNATDIIF